MLQLQIPENARAVLLLCNFNHQAMEISITRAITFESAFEGMMTYAEIPNPESQIVTGESYEHLMKQLDILLNQMQDPAWLQKLADSI